MKNKLLLFACLVLIAGLCDSTAKAQTSAAVQPDLFNDYPWTNHDLIEPATLAGMINQSPPKSPLILNIGAVEDIKGAKHIGPVSGAKNITILKSMVAPLPKNTAIVIYCGCCPFTRCPNAKPAFKELKELGFTNIKLLNLPVNLHTNWTSKGYPLAVN